MKNILTLTITMLLLNISYAQNGGTIKYIETQKLEINGIEGIDLGDMIPSEMTSYKELIYLNSISVYKESKDNIAEDVEMESDDGSFKMVFKSSEGEEILYTDTKKKTSIHQTSFMGKEFLIEEKLERPKWKITNEKIKYLGFVCQKATLVEMINPPSNADKQERLERNIIAWFTSEIPASIGPRGYHQLPGAILMVSVDDGKTEIKATEVLSEIPIQESVQQPTKGQRVSQEEFENIMEEKMKEMSQAFGSGENAIMIRG